MNPNVKLLIKIISNFENNFTLNFIFYKIIYPIQYLNKLNAIQISQWSLKDAVQRQRSNTTVKHDLAFYVAKQNSKITWTPYKLKKVIFIKANSKLNKKI